MHSKLISLYNMAVPLLVMILHWGAIVVFIIAVELYVKMITSMHLSLSETKTKYKLKSTCMHSLRHQILKLEPRKHRFNEIS